MHRPCAYSPLPSHLSAQAAHRLHHMLTAWRTERLAGSWPQQAQVTCSNQGRMGVSAYVMHKYLQLV